MRALLLLLAVYGCAKPAPDKIAETPTDRFAEVAARAGAMTWPDGWITCVKPDGSRDCLGDSLIFSGLAMGADDCEHGQIYEDALVGMIHDNDGELVRHPTIRGSSLDGALGFLWGMAQRARRCPASTERLSAAVRAYSERNARPLEPYFPVVVRQVLHDMGDGDPPSEHDRGLLGSELAGWALAVVSTQAAAFRLHLGYLAFSLVDAPKGKTAYCAAVEKAKIPLIEAFCGRPGLLDWLRDFRYNEWEYRHQRGAWEDPDGDGRETAGVDFLVGYRQAYGG